MDEATRKIIREEYKGYVIHALASYQDLGKKVIDGNYKTLEIYKDMERTFVSKIEVDSKYYIFKSPRSDVYQKRKRWQSFWKKGEAVTTLENIQELRALGCDFLVEVYVAVTKKKFFLEESFFLMEVIQEIPEEIRIWKEAMQNLAKLHRLGRYHGDFNPSNFCLTNNGVRFIDTQGKKDIFSNFRRAYDLLTIVADQYVYSFEKDILQYYPLEYKKIGWKFAYWFRKIKYSKWIYRFRRIRRHRRERKWKKK
ncbi:MAG: lipopolysaccharide biosynthesis protein [Fusobacterium necrophorum]|nr:lipopolysaccharide biosynthesis protein [Fusobacterium necrophorum]MDY2573406.1 lipopolysaccharide core heptose(II) kinase RfaY [Fusobacterium necrophorum]